MRSHYPLRTIAIAEWLKGGIALSAGMVSLTAGPKEVHQWISYLSARIHTGHARGPFAWIDAHTDTGSLDIVAALCLVYALVRGIEGWGLWHSRRWAEWFGLLGTAAYLPLDVISIARHPGAGTVTLLAINVLIVGVLALQLRRRASGSGGS